jgi:hypothetical protein
VLLCATLFYWFLSENGNTAGDKTSAEDDPNHPADATTVVIVYEDALNEDLSIGIARSRLL